MNHMHQHYIGDTRKVSQAYYYCNGLMGEGNVGSIKRVKPTLALYKCHNNMVVGQRGLGKVGIVNIRILQLYREELEFKQEIVPCIGVSYANTQYTPLLYGTYIGDYKCDTFLVVTSRKLENSFESTTKVGHMYKQRITKKKNGGKYEKIVFVWKYIYNGRS